MALSPELRDVIAAFWQDAKERAPEEFGERLKHADSLKGLIGLVFDLAAAVPDQASYFFHLLARLLRERGGKRWKLAADFLDIVPPATRTLREASGKTEASALADLRERWNTFSSNPTPTRGVMNAILGDLMSTTTSAAPSAPAAPKSSLSKLQKALTDGSYTADQRALLLCLFMLCLREAQPGTDLFKEELEGVAGATKASMVDTLRENENGIVKMLDAESPDFIAALERYKEMRKLEIAGLEHGDNRKKWKVEAGFFVRLMYPVLQFLLIGHADRHPDSAMHAKIADFLDKLNVAFDTPPSSAFEKAKKFKALMAKVSKQSAVTTGLMLAHILITIFLTLAFPGTLFWWSWISTFGLLGLAAAVMIGGSAAQKIAGLVGALFITPPLLTVALVLTTVFAPNVEWSTWWMTLLVAVGMDFVSAGLAQSAANGIGAIPGFIKSLVPGLDDNEAKEMAKKVLKGHFLTQITSTVGGAIALAWIPVLLAMLLSTPSNIRIGGMAVVVAVAIAYGYLKRHATMRDYAKFEPELRPTIVKQDVQNLEYGYNAVRYSPVAVAAFFILVRLFGAESLQNSVDDIAGKTKRVGGVGSAVAEQQIRAAEDTVRENRSGNDRQESGSSDGDAAEELRQKDLKALDRVYDGDYCRTHKGYPCK